MSRRAIRNPDLTNTSRSYWDRVLESHNLSMDRGLDPDIIYVGTSNDLAIVEEHQAGLSYGAGGGRRVAPRGHGPQ